MKKLAIIAGCLLVSAYSYGQGTINFDTSAAYGNGYAFVDSNGNNVLDAGEALATGPQYVGQLFGSTTANGTYTAIGSPLAFNSTVPVLAGYIDTGGDVTLVGQGPGSYYVKLYGWSIADPLNVGMSAPAAVTLGGPTDPPSPAGDLGNLGPTAIPAVPEPTTIALGLIGAAALLLRRRQ